MSTPRKRQRHRPEFDTVAVPIKREMEKAGFVARFLGKTIWNGRVWVSAVPKDTPDWYYHHPERKLSVWVETKAPGESLTPGQRAFLEDHAGSETQAVCWDDVQECIDWLTLKGLRRYDQWFSHNEQAWIDEPTPTYPFGIHRAPDAGGPVTWEEM